MTNVNVTAVELMPIGGAANDGTKLGFIDSATKAAQNDTLTVTNASSIKLALALTDADGVADPCTISSNVITLTGATATSPSLLIVYTPA